MTVWQMGSVRRIDWILNDMLHLATEIIVISLQVWIILWNVPCSFVRWMEIDTRGIHYLQGCYLSPHKYQSVTAVVKIVRVACVEELQSLVTLLIYFSYRKIQVIAKPSFMLLLTGEIYEWAVCLLLHFTFKSWSCRDPFFFGLQYAVDQDCSHWPVVWSG